MTFELHWNTTRSGELTYKQDFNSYEEAAREYEDMKQAEDVKAARLFENGELLKEFPRKPLFEIGLYNVYEVKRTQTGGVSVEFEDILTGRIACYGIDCYKIPALKGLDLRSCKHLAAVQVLNYLRENGFIN